MSIPPLVCSTPPPPDQCEDDKDPGDFDLSYSLSQEDDDDENNDYNYGSFSSYSHYPSNNKPLEIKNPEITGSMDTGIHKEIFIQCQDSEETKESRVSQNKFQTNDINENKLKCDEDINIEDLDLKLDEEIVTTIGNSDENESSEPNADSLKDLNIPCNSNINSQVDGNTDASSYDDVIGPILGLKDPSIDLEAANDEQTSDIKNIPEDFDLNNLKDKDSSSPLNLDDLSTGSTLQISDGLLENFKTCDNEVVDDDDFEDFDDFQFVNTKSNVTSIVDSSNPWENNESNESDFGEFTANFQETRVSPIAQDTIQIQKPTSNSDQLENEVKEEVSNLDDDFGDFDDFQSSTATAESNEIQDPCQELSVLNLQSADNDLHIMDSITKVLTTVFIEEITEPDVQFNGKLESLLSETWGYLMETDERQPYIVNWNNSLGQKTLLKALCIDSRNILFGPKWSSHMPKYAANLSVAPLQPKKQVSTSSNVSEVVPDKAAVKPTTWSDPFTSDGQESCKTEQESSTISSRPTDLEVFEAAMSEVKSEKIFSSTLNVQPIRQINLPDTHIFTPTDSEIPRSKTIHYDSRPTVLLPQPVLADSKATTDIPKTNANTVAIHNTDDNEYWEFQDFKSTPDSSSISDVSQPNLIQDGSTATATTVNALPNASVAFQTQLLQPIKVEHSMPTLNWPDPGEVKPEYDDFTDFVSISTQSIEKLDSVNKNVAELETQANDIVKNNMTNLKEKSKDFTEELKPANQAFDDFETFQSALTLKSGQSNYYATTFGNSITQTPTSQVADIDYTSSRNNNVKSDSISFTTNSRPNEVLSHNVGYNLNATDLINKGSLSSSTQLQTGLLQPMPASFSAANTHNQRTTGQILQPLSLESYSQINWPSPGIDLQDLSRFNPVETLQSLKSDLSISGVSKQASPAHSQKNTSVNLPADDDVWGDFVSSKPKQQSSAQKKPAAFVEDDEWTDFISSPSVKPQNGLNTISLNVHTNSNIQKTVLNHFPLKNNQMPVDIPTLNYITPKSNPHNTFSDKHFQNL